MEPQHDSNRTVASACGRSAPRRGRYRRIHFRRTRQPAENLLSRRNLAPARLPARLRTLRTPLGADALDRGAGKPGTTSARAALEFEVAKSNSTDFDPKDTFRALKYVEYFGSLSRMRPTSLGFVRPSYSTNQA